MSKLDPSRLHHLMRAHSRSVRLRVWMIACIGAAGLMAFIPLFNLVGFGFSFAMAIVASLASLDLSSALWRRARAPDTAPDTTTDAATDAAIDTVPAGIDVRVAHDAPLATLLRLMGWAAAIHVIALLVPPLIIMSVNGVRVRNCDWAFGLHAYALMPVLSCVGATMAGVLVGVAAGRRRVLGNVMPYALFVLLTLYAVWRFYAAPPVFSYNLLAGYFPGNLYDEDLAFHAPFYWARLYEFAVLFALTCAAAVFLWAPRSSLKKLHGQRLAAVVLAGCLALIAGWLGRNSGDYGFDIDARDIQRHLGARYDTEHFVIFYPPGGAIERDIHRIADDHEFRYAQVSRLLGATPRRRITSYYFADAHDKQRMMGAGQVYMAKPWRDEIYLHHQGFPHQVVRHEITHVIAGVFGSPVFHVSADTWLGLPVVFNVGLIEGIAVAADWPGRPERSLTPHESVKAMIEMGMAPPVERLLSTGFLSFSSARSYTMAGSLVRYLLDTRGPDKLRRLYQSGGDFMAVYGESQGDILREWRAMIDRIELPGGTAEIVRERFRTPSILARPCPHAIARQRALMVEKLATGDIPGALALARRVVSQAPDEPRYRLELASVLVNAGDIEPASEIYREIRENQREMSSSLRADATFQLAAIAARARDFDTVTTLLRETDDLPLEDGEQRYVDALRFAAEHDGPARAALRDYFWRYDPRYGADAAVLTGRAAAIVVADPGLGLGHYLLGRNMSDRGVPEDVARTLARALDLGLPSLALEREAARILASAGYRSGQLDVVERAATVMLDPGQPVVTQLSGLDWLERVYWKRHGRLPDGQASSNQAPEPSTPEPPAPDQEQR